MSSSSVDVKSLRPFIQLVSFGAKDTASRQQLLSLWQPAIDHVKRTEAGSVTSTYEGFIPSGSDLSSQEEADTELLVFETYSSHDEFERVHMGATEVKDLIAGAAPLVSRAPSINFLQAMQLGFHTRGAEREEAVRAQGVKPFTLVVTFQLRDAQSVDQFATIFGPMAAYVRDHEAEALTYEAYRSLSTPNQVVIFERYTSEAFLRDTHWTSDAFVKLGGELEKANIIVAKGKRTYEELQVGIWGKQ